MTQQHTPSNNRNANNPNVNTAVLYSHKTRGTHTRVSRVRVTTVGKPPFPEKPIRSCPRCKESTSSMKILTARVGRIEQLVTNLAKTTRGLMSKRDDRFSQHNLKFARLDLTNCTLQELQKLVVATTNVMAPSNPNKSTLQKSAISAKDVVSDVKIITTSDKIHSEPLEEPMEDVKIYSEEQSSHNHQQQTTEPMETTETTETTSNKTISSLKRNKSLRQDSGFEDMIPSPDEKQHADNSS